MRTAANRSQSVAVAALALLVGIAAGVVSTSLVIGTSPEPARPQGVALTGWAEAASLAGVALRAPSNEDAPDEIVAWGVAGDPYRPIEARWSSGLRTLQTRADLLPPDDGIGELIRVDGADDSWWHEELDNRYLVVLDDDTITLLSGTDDESLQDAAASLEPIRP